MTFKAFPKIEQFRNTIANVSRHYQYVGQDENDEAIYDRTKDLPIISFKGTVKLHGTNAAIGYNIATGDLWVQSRKNIITPENDNAGFAKWVAERSDYLEGYFDEIVYGDIDVNIYTDSILVYGEWCGGNIQKGVGITGLDKMFVAFAVRLINLDGTSEFIDPKYFDPNPEVGLYNIGNFPGATFNIIVDFTRPDLAQNLMVTAVQAVEEECPVAKHFGVSGIGEGIVWLGGEDKSTDDGRPYMFKTKGEKHSVSKVKKIVEIDTAKMDNIHEFIEYAVTENRLNQCLKETFKEEEPSMKGTGDFLRWLMKDISTEEKDVLEKNNLTGKDVNKYIATRARTWLMKHLDERVGI